MKQRLIPLALAVLTLSLTSSGCAVIGGGSGGHDYGGATLSDAARAATDSTGKVRRDEPSRGGDAGDVGWTRPPEPEVGVGVAVGSEEGNHLAEASGGSGSGSGGDASGPHFGVVALGGGLGGDTYDGFGGAGLELGFVTESRLRVDAIGTWRGVNFTGQSVAGQAFKNEWELSLDLTGRYYLTPPHTFMGLYPVAGFGFGTLFWDLAQPVTVTENGETKTVSSDWVNYFTLYGGAGLSLMQFRHFHVGLNLTGGVRLYDVQTNEGFSNDLLPDTGFFQTTVEMTFQ